MKNKLLFIALVVLLLNIYLFPKAEKEEKEVFIYPNKYTITVLGEVAFPGNYTFFDTVSLIEVINYSGGFTSEANTNKINFNEEFNRTGTIVIDKKSDEVNDEINKLVNINTATYGELILVDNITETRAINILLYREKNGLFKNIEEILNVSQIGDSTFAKIKNNITV